MNIHKIVRKEIVELLSNNVEGVKHFYNGNAFFSDIQDQLPAVSVSIPQSVCEGVGFSATEWSGTLEITIFMPLFEDEDRLDDLAEQINKLIRVGYGYKSIRQFRPGVEYGYTFDTEQHLWKSATLSYSIDYGQEIFN
ncbi:phage tail terminator protein [Testudinibacter sp. P27/CKL/0425]